MHIRNRYRSEPPDFVKLGTLDAEFRKCLMDGKIVDWKNPNTLRELIRVLLKVDFKIDWSLPNNYLCPPLGNRLNYIHWIEDLLPGSIGNDQIVGLDIGTGASLIYPLLGVSINSWTFHGTDINPEAIAHSKSLIERNKFEHKIFVHLVKPQDSMFRDMKINFSMCNPPFFDHMDEASTNPDAYCDGNIMEMTTPGGEVGFISQMIYDSAIHQGCTWYTTMIGRKRSISPLIRVLKQKGITNFTTTVFYQGNTRRWGLAWSFLPKDQVKVPAKHHKTLKQKRAEYGFNVPIDISARIQPAIDHIEGNGTKVTKSNDKVYTFVLHKEELCYRGKLHIDGTHCSLTFIEGSRRNLFWQMAQKFESEMLRTSRKWRRAAK